jgi:hypothetical protein
MSRPSNSPRTPTFHGRDTSYAGSVYSASSSRPKKCILEDEELASKLMHRVDRLLSNNPNRSRHEGLMGIKLRDEMISFYDEYAYGPAGHPSEASLLAEISKYRPPNTIVIVDAVDKMYFEAGWHLKRRPLEEPCSPILDAPHSSPSLPRPSSKSSQYRAPPTKRRPKSRSGTSPSGKRSKQNSTQQSFTSAASESRTSVSRSEAPKEFPCHLCTDPKAVFWNPKAVFQELRKWKRHYDIHFPPSFWECDKCNFISNRSDGIKQHCAGETHPRNIQWSPELSQQLKGNKFRIPDAGHERCIYCKADFHGWNNIKRKSHIADHVEKDTAESLLESFDHRCTDPRCGEPEYWKQSKYVLPGNRKRADADDDTRGTSRYDESEGDDGNYSTGTLEDKDEQGGGNSTSRGQGGRGRGRGGRNRREMGGGSEGRGRGSGRGKGGMRGGRGGPMPGNRLSSTSGRRFSGCEHPSLQSLRKSPEAFRSPISAYLDDTTTYSVDGSWMPSRTSVPAVVGYMGSHLEEMSHPLERNKQ